MIPFSFELFPPKTERGKEKLIETVQRLSALRPEFFSITCGAQGSDHCKTIDIVNLLLPETHIPLRPHITCIGATKKEIRERLDYYLSVGINQIVALRGDKANHPEQQSSEFQFAIDLIRFVRDEYGDAFHIAVGAYPEIHPESETGHDDLLRFKEKMDAGVEMAITQFFFNAPVYETFVNACRDASIMQPIIPGVLPIRDWQQTEIFAGKCGATFSEALKEKFKACDKDRQAECAINLTVELCQSLVEAGAPALHFYTLNNANLVESIINDLLN